MNAIIQGIETKQISKLIQDKKIPTFKPGDTLKVHTKVIEGKRERIQIYEGVCIARKNAALNSSFTVRKISFGEGVERVFPLYSPNIAKVEVVRIGDVRRAKLYYMRALRGRKARIAEDIVAAQKMRAAEKEEKLALQKQAEKEKIAKKEESVSMDQQNTSKTE